MNEIFEGLGKELRKNGCTTRAVKGWKTRGTSSFAPRGILFHHTASNKDSGNAPALGICTHGRSDLPGPLCHFLVGRDGIVYFVAAERANHAGTGGPIKGIPTDSGNSFLVGVECENNGIGEPWPARQLDAILTLFAVLTKRMDVGSAMVIGHKEYTTRKIDPANINLDTFRTRVAKRRKSLGRKTFRVVARKVVDVLGGKKARALAKRLRKQGFKVETKERK
jgi:N-acetyl-anhydromuramyl-L-alanine amidase AmpD